MFSYMGFFPSHHDCMCDNGKIRALLKHLQNVIILSIQWKIKVNTRHVRKLILDIHVYINNAYSIKDNLSSKVRRYVHANTHLAFTFLIKHIKKTNKKQKLFKCIHL